MDEPPTDIVDRYRPPGLTHLDRCDSCGAQAVWSTWFDADLLLWCQHHFTKYETKLRATATDIIQDPDMAALLHP